VMRAHDERDAAFASSGMRRMLTAFRPEDNKFMSSKALCSVVGKQFRPAQQGFGLASSAVA